VQLLENDMNEPSSMNAADEHAGLRAEISRLRSERDQLSKALLLLLREDTPVNEEEVFAQIGLEQPIREFLKDLQAELVED
jgi:hypothetical protein